MRKKILIIDDEVDFCIIMKGYFIKRGYEFFSGHDLKTGLALIKDLKPDILFLDNNLPDGHGWKFSHQIVEENPHLKVFLVSAHEHKSGFISTNENIVVWEKPISFQVLNHAFG